MSHAASGERPDDGDPVPSQRTAITVELLDRAKQGDAEALSQIMEKYAPRLQFWATARLPRYARSMFDTSDLVQDSLARTLQGLDRVEVRGPGGFEAYVRQAILNGIKDQIRRARVRGNPEDMSDELVHSAPSPLEEAIGVDLLERFERGMSALDPEDRRLLHLRIELDFDFDEIAAATGRPSRDAARMALQRALARLSRVMGHDRRP